MFANILSPILGAFFISLALIHLSSNINPSLHLSLKNHFKQIYDNLSIESISFEGFQFFYTISLLISGFFLLCFQGLKRLIILIPLSIGLICIVQWIIISGLFLVKIPVYVLIVVCVLIILFDDCSEFDEFDH